MKEVEKERLALARWAVDRWAGFPVSVEPRPLVLCQSVIENEEGFRSGEAKDAWFDGRYEWVVDVPARVRARARRSADREPQELVGAPLRITHAGRAEYEFRTDRGGLTLPAYWLKGPAIIGSLWVLDPQVDHWEPGDGAGGHRPRSSTQGQPLMRSFRDQIAVASDGLSITVPWMVGARPGDYRVELIETATAVSGVAINHAKPTADLHAWVAVGRTLRLPAQLREPIGNRVFVDLFGEAMNIVPSNA